VRHGRVFRSDSLASLSDADMGYIVATLGLRTAVDLRAGHEVDEYPHRLVVDAGIVVHHRPIVDETRRRPGDAPLPERGIDEIYVLMLDRFGDRFAAVVDLIADADGHPVVFFCAAGKDRTGLVAAVVLGALGVPDETIAADYAFTAGVLPVLAERNRVRAEARGASAEVQLDAYGRALATAEAATMLSVLSQLRADHGSVEGYLERHGLAPESVGSLRAGLLA
jgi:protein-tyrosine phosphatase